MKKKFLIIAFVIPMIAVGMENESFDQNSSKSISHEELFAVADVACKIFTIKSKIQEDDNSDTTVEKSIDLIQHFFENIRSYPTNELIFGPYAFKLRKQANNKPNHLFTSQDFILKDSIEKKKKKLIQQLPQYQNTITEAFSNIKTYTSVQVQKIQQQQTRQKAKEVQEQKEQQKNRDRDKFKFNLTLGVQTIWVLMYCSTAFLIARMCSKMQINFSGTFVPHH